MYSASTKEIEMTISIFNKKMHDCHHFKKLLLLSNLRQVCCRLNDSGIKDALI